MSTSTWDYDLFVLYGARDVEWVRENLLRRLQGWGISYAIDFNDFAPGKTISSECSRLLRTSRMALVVLSSYWLASPVSAAQSGLVMSLRSEGSLEQAILLRVDGCEVGDTPAGFEMVDAAGTDTEQPWIRLHRILLERLKPLGTYQLFGELSLCHEPSEHGYQGYAYLADASVENPASEAVVCDAIRLGFATRGQLTLFPKASEGVSIFKVAGGMEIYTEYSDAKRAARFMGHPPRTAPEDTQPIRLPGFARATVRAIRLNNSPVSIPGSNVVAVSLHLSVGETQITDKCLCVLPPVSRLPDLRAAERHKVELVCERFLPSPSGILDGKVLPKAFQTASRYSDDHMLLRVAPRFVTVHDLGDCNLFHTCSSWCLTFFDRGGGRTFNVQSLDPGWVEDSERAENLAAPARWLTRELMESCVLDCREAYLMARATGADPLEETELQLEGENVGGSWRPMWKLPFMLDGARVGVLADSCGVAVLSGSGWHSAKKSVWNTG